MNMSYYGSLFDLVEDIKKDCGGWETYSYKAKGNELNIEFFLGDDIVCEGIFVLGKDLLEGSYVVDEDIYDFSVKTDEKLHHLFARLG